MLSLTTMPVLSDTATKNEISATELSQRVAVIKRFRELLQAQRDRFQEYLNTMDRQKYVIEKGNADDLLRHVELEEKIVEDIFSIQKVIDPLELMYQSSKPSRFETIDKTEEEVSGLKDVLEGLKAEAIIRSARNRDLLAHRMEEIRAEINSLKTNVYARNHFKNEPAPTLVDLRG